MARIITKEIAVQIARKLGAVKDSKKGRPHDMYTFSYLGVVIARFGIRHGSAKDQGHDFISKQIFLSPRDAKLFGQCDHSLEWYIAKLKEEGQIEGE
jgi:hypothetical protein